MGSGGLAELIARWDAQQARYLPGREERFGLICDLVEQIAPPSPRILDLCAGPGSLSARLLERLPQSSVTAVDFDPAHIELGRRRLGERVNWCELDLRQPGWDEQFADGSFDAVVTATAIHWFTAEEIVPLYRSLSRLLPQAESSRTPTTCRSAPRGSQRSAPTSSTAGRTSNSPAPRTTPTTAQRSGASRRSQKMSRQATSCSGTGTQGAHCRSRSTRLRSRSRASRKPARCGDTTPTSGTTVPRGRRQLAEPPARADAGAPAASEDVRGKGDRVTLDPVSRAGCSQLFGRHGPSRERPGQEQADVVRFGDSGGAATPSVGDTLLVYRNPLPPGARLIGQKSRRTSSSTSNAARRCSGSRSPSR